MACVGREWYRFPASFYLPSTSRLGFIRSGFGGILPRGFLESESGDRRGARVIPPAMNDENREEEERYVADPNEGECVHRCRGCHRDYCRFVILISHFPSLSLSLSLSFFLIFAQIVLTMLTWPWILSPVMIFAPRRSAPSFPQVSIQRSGMS